MSGPGGELRTESPLHNECLGFPELIYQPSGILFQHSLSFCAVIRPFIISRQININWGFWGFWTKVALSFIQGIWISNVRRRAWRKACPEDVGLRCQGRNVNAAPVFGWSASRKETRKHSYFSEWEELIQRFVRVFQLLGFRTVCLSGFSKKWNNEMATLQNRPALEQAGTP